MAGWFGPSFGSCSCCTAPPIDPDCYCNNVAPGLGDTYSTITFTGYDWPTTSSYSCDTGSVIYTSSNWSTLWNFTRVFSTDVANCDMPTQYATHGFATMRAARSSDTTRWREADYSLGTSIIASTSTGSAGTGGNLTHIFIITFALVQVSTLRTNGNQTGLPITPVIGACYEDAPCVAGSQLCGTPHFCSGDDGAYGNPATALTGSGSHKTIWYRA